MGENELANGEGPTIGEGFGEVFEYIADTLTGLGAVVGRRPLMKGVECKPISTSEDAYTSTLSVLTSPK